MERVFHSFQIIAIVGLIIAAVGTPTSLAQTPTPTPGGPTYVVAECGSFWLNTSVWLDKSIEPWQCGVPVGATNIAFHVKINGFSGSPSVHVYRMVGSDSTRYDECDIPDGSNPLLGGECATSPINDTVAQHYIVSLDESPAGSIDAEMWFTADVGMIIVPPSATPSATPNPSHTPTNTPVGTVAPSTPTSTAIKPTPTAPNFTDPNYGGGLPTPIATLSFPSSGYLPTPAPLSGATPIPTLASASVGLSLSYPTPAPFTGTAHLSSTQMITGVLAAVDGTRSVISGILTYTNMLSGNIHAVMVATDTMLFDTVPDWYAPYMPRPAAQVGWDFETMGTDLRRRYSVPQWTAWIAEMLAIPVQYVKALFPWARALGPLGLFLAWLFVMLPIVLVFKILAWLKDALISLFNLLIEFIKLILDILGLIPGL